MHFYNDVINSAIVPTLRPHNFWLKGPTISWNFPKPKLAPKKFLDPTLSGSKEMAEKLL